MEEKKKIKKEKVVEAEVIEEKKEKKNVRAKVEHRGEGVVGAVFLVIAGILLMLNNFGVLPWTIWPTLLQFWPIFLILGGVQLILGRSWVARIIMILIAIIVINLAVAVSIAKQRDDFSEWMDQNFPNLRTSIESLFQTEYLEETLSVLGADYEDVEARELEVNIGATQFTMVDDSSFDDHLILDARYFQNFNKPVLDSDMSNSVLSMDFTTESKPMFHLGDFSDSGFDFTFGQTSIPTDLVVDLGAGKGTLEFSDQIFGTIDLDIGAGEMNVELSEDSIPSEKLKVNVGAGSFNLSVPEDVGLKVTYDVGVGRFSILGDLVNADGTYESDNYEDAEIKLELEVNLGAGSVKIE